MGFHASVIHFICSQSDHPFPPQLFLVQGMLYIIALKKGYRLICIKEKNLTTV